MKKDQENIIKKLVELDSNEEKELGFESNFSLPGVRLMNKDGSLNVHFSGKDRFRKWNLYKRFIKMSNWQFFLSILISYVLLNIIFATYFYLFGPEGLSMSQSSFGWVNCFWFSTQTFTTVGYGHISPASLWVNVGASFEAFVGLIFFAVATSLVYARFTSSQVDIRFSSNILLSGKDESAKLSLRLANISNSELSDLDAIVIISYIEKIGNHVSRRYKKIPLTLDHISILTTSWTLEHIIHAESPCKQMLNKEQIQGLEFLVFITAFDEVYDQKIKVRTSYLGDDVIHSAKFVPITSYEKDKTIVNLDKLSSYQKI